MKPVNQHSRTGYALRRIAISAMVAAAAMASQGVASAQSMPGHAGMPGMAGSGAKTDAKGPMKMHMAMEEMQKKMSAMTMTGKADTDFAMMMVVHHQGAIDMAKAELASGKNPEMRKTAEKVIAAQTKEIAQLEAWLKKNPQSK